MANNRVLFVSEQQIKTDSLLEDNADPRVISRLTLEAQMLWIEPLLGSKLYDAICDAIAAYTENNTPIPQPYINLITKALAPYIIQIVVRDYLVQNNYKLTNKGTLKFNDTQATALANDELQGIKQVFDEKVSAYKAMVIRYLKDEDNATALGINNRCGGTNSDVTVDAIGWYLPGLRVK